jgi:hypothetical protein
MKLMHEGNNIIVDDVIIDIGAFHTIITTTFRCNWSKVLK